MVTFVEKFNVGIEAVLKNCFYHLASCSVRSISQERCTDLLLSNPPDTRECEEQKDGKSGIRLLQHIVKQTVDANCKEESPYDN